MPRNISNVDTGGGGGGGDASLPSDPTFNSVQASTTIAAQGNISTGASMIAGGLTVNGVSNHNSIANFSAPIVASGQTISANEVAATTCKASTIQSLDGADETLVVRANFITRPVGSTLQIVPDQLNASSMVSSDLNISAGSDITAVGNIVSASGKVEATNGPIVGVTSSISSRVTCGSIHVSNGSYDDQEIKCGRLTLSSGQHDGWAILQGSSGSDLQDTLGIVMPNTNGVLTVVDENNNPLLIQSKLGLISQTPMNQNANLFLSAGSDLRFGGYTFQPIQYQRVIPTFTFRATDDTTNFTNRLFDFRTNTDWTNNNTGATNQSLYITSSEGFYKVAVELLGSSSQGNFNFIRILFDYTLCFSVQASPDTEPAITYSYRIKPANATPSVNVNFLASPVQSQPCFLRFDNQASGETFSNVVVRVTKMNY